jgi:hypothetical protein
MLVDIAGQQGPLGGDFILSVDGIGVDTANITKIRDHMNRLRAGSPFPCEDASDLAAPRFAGDRAPARADPLELARR